VAIVWPCPLPVDAYVAAGGQVEFPRPDCSSCAGPLVFWSGCRRYVRAAGRCRKIFVPRVRCGRCRVTHALLPAFVLVRRLDVAEAVGGVVEEVSAGPGGVRPAAARADVPYTTARGWVRRFGARARDLGVAFAALAVDLGGEAIRPAAGASRFALAAIGAAFDAASALPGWLQLGRWARSTAGSNRASAARTARSAQSGLGRADLAPEHRDLMTQHHDLRILGRLAATQQE
jgi:hypothetical protein